MTITASARMRRGMCALIAAAAVAGTAACSSGDAGTAAGSDGGTVTVRNCGREVTFPKNIEKVMINDGNIISIGLSAGARDRITAVSSIQRDHDILSAKYGDDVVDGLDDVAEKYPSLETIIAADPELYVAGWNYGLGESTGVTPELLAQHGIDTYVLTESCRQADGARRGIVDPWTALDEDIANLGTLIGDESAAEEVIDGIDARIATLEAAPKPEKAPNVFLFDSATETVFTSGRFGAPQGIIELAGGRNAAESVDDTWTSVNWELIAEQQPDVFVFVDYPGQSYEEKIAILRSNPTTRDLPAVQQERFVNLPYAMWCESPLNVDAAEWLRRSLEEMGLAPASDVAPQLELPAGVPGMDRFRA